MGWVTFLKRTAASVSTPSTGKVALFIDSSDGATKIKDDAGNVTDIPATVSDGDKGDVTVTGGVWTLDAGVVDYANIQDVSAASKLLGRGDSGSGAVQEITLGTGLTMTGTTLSAGGAAVADGDYGDITVSSSGTVWNIDANAVGSTEIADEAVTNAKLAHMTQATIKGRQSGGGTGDAEDLTAAQAAVIVQGDGLDVDAAGFRGIPQNAQTGNYTLVAADAGKSIYHASGAGSGDTYTIPANSSVAFEVGTAVTFINMATDTVAIAITTDTLYLAGTGTTGSRTLAQYGVATAVKLTSTTWIISGTGLT